MYSSQSNGQSPFRSQPQFPPQQNDPNHVVSPQFGGGNHPNPALYNQSYSQQSQQQQQQQHPNNTTAYNPFQSNSPYGQQPSQFYPLQLHHPSSSSSSSSGGPTLGQDAPRHYLPGYLSASTLNQSQSSPLHNSSNNNNDDSPNNNRGSISGSSPVSRFGGQSLFGPRDGTPSRSPKGLYSRDGPKGRAPVVVEMEEDAPPIESLAEMESNESMSSPGKPSTYTTSSADLLPSSSSSSPPIPRHSSIYVFGFPSSSLPLVLSHFAQFGEIVASAPSPEGGNWVTLTYADAWSAARAARRNGEILGGVLMVGVKLLDEESSSTATNGGGAGRASPNPSGISTPARMNGGNGSSASTSTPSGVGRPVALVSAGSAFKPPASTPTRLSFLTHHNSSTNGNSTTTKAGGHLDPHASLFAEKHRQAILNQSEQQGQNGVLGKISDLIFGW